MKQTGNRQFGHGLLGACVFGVIVAVGGLTLTAGGGIGGGSIGMTDPGRVHAHTPNPVPQPVANPGPCCDGKWRVFGINPADGMPDPGPKPEPIGGLAKNAGASPSRPSSGTRSGSVRVVRGGSSRGGSDRGHAARGTAASSRSGSAFVIDRLGMWETWWEHNDDRLLNIKANWARGNRPASVTSTLGVLTARGRRTMTTDAPPEWLVREKLMPLLSDLLEQEDEPLLLSAALMTLGRATPAGESRRVRPAMTEALAHDVRSVRATAALALGILGDAESAPLLRSLALDEPQGRLAVGGGSVDWLVRSVSALSLGLIGADDDIDVLIEVFEAAGPTDRDLRIAALVALGLMDGARKQTASEYLSGLLTDRHLDATVASYVPLSLARLGDPATVPVLVSLLQDDDTHSLLLQSAAIALGRLVRADDSKSLRTLIELSREGRDEHARNFATIALGRIGARATAGTQQGTPPTSLIAFFKDELKDPSHFTGRSWTAIGAGLFSRESALASTELMEPLRRAYRHESDPNHKSAFAMALGLSRAVGAGPEILDDLRDRKDETFRGYAAMSLGLLQHLEAMGDLSEIALSRSASPDFRRQAATGQALMGGREGLSELIEQLARDETTQGRAAATRALAVAGDWTSVPALLAIAESESESVASRAFACVALGLVCERSLMPWNLRLSEDHNYIASTSIMELVLSVL